MIDDGNYGQDEEDKEVKWMIMDQAGDSSTLSAIAGNNDHDTDLENSGFCVRMDRHAKGWNKMKLACLDSCNVSCKLQRWKLVC